MKTSVDAMDADMDKLRGIMGERWVAHADAKRGRSEGRSGRIARQPAAACGALQSRPAAPRNDPKPTNHPPKNTTQTTSPRRACRSTPSCSVGARPARSCAGWGTSWPSCRCAGGRGSTACAVGQGTPSGWIGRGSQRIGGGPSTAAGPRYCGAPQPV